MSAASTLIATPAEAAAAGKSAGATCNLVRIGNVYFALLVLRCGLVIMMMAAWVALAAPDEPVYDIGPGIAPPRVTHQVTPQTKPDARGFRLSGTVVVGLIVTSKGEPKDVHVITSLDKDVDQTAVEAVQQWTFAPARKGDQPVAVRITVEIRFHSL